MGTEMLAVPDLLAAASMNLNDAWNMSWGEGIQFILVLTFLYWLKKRMDLHFAKKQSKIVYRVKVVEDSHINVDHAHIDEIEHNHVEGDLNTHSKTW
mgnify:FL=1|tara:strand:+ start:326 stop:616 length:291 start_codon:yes stop_codon:yes gene_type:complete